MFSVGRHLDTVLRTPAGLNFASRACIHDAEMIPNSILDVRDGRPTGHPATALVRCHPVKSKGGRVFVRLD